MAAKWQGDHPGWSDPAVKAVAVTPSDSTDLTVAPCRALWVGGAGAVAVILADDTSGVTFSAVPAGTLLRVAAKRVLSTGTTATAILALY